MKEDERERLIENISGSLGKCRTDIKERMVKLFLKVDPDYGQRISKAIGVSLE